jgi:hypothetical protein
MHSKLLNLKEKNLFIGDKKIFEWKMVFIYKSIEIQQKQKLGCSITKNKIFLGL